MNPRKVGIIGCGNVGASIAFSLMPRRLFSHMVLLDIDQACAEGEAMDLSHGSPYAAAMTIEAGSYPSLADCSLVIITAGAMQKAVNHVLILSAGMCAHSRRSLAASPKPLLWEFFSLSATR